VTLVRGEPQAQETFEYLKKSSKQLVVNQHKQHDRMVRLEATMDAYALVRKEQKEDVTQKLLMLMTGAIAARRAAPRSVRVARPTASAKRPTRRCRPRYIRVDGRCMKPVDAVNAKVREVEVLRSKSLADRKQMQAQMQEARKAREVEQRPAAPPIPDELKR
jgi:hypothetical protein